MVAPSSHDAAALTCFCVQRTYVIDELAALVPLSREMVDFLLMKDYGESLTRDARLLASLRPDDRVRALMKESKEFDKLVLCW